MTQILPVAFRGIMEAHVRETLFGLCNFFDVISRKSVGVRKHRRPQEEIEQFFTCLLGVKLPYDNAGKISKYLDPSVAEVQRDEVS